jgi:hypothetical protein
VCFSMDVRRADDVGQEIEAGGYAEDGVRYGGGFQQQVAWSGHTNWHMSMQNHKASGGPQNQLVSTGMERGTGPKQRACKSA